jgi:tRNA modification GTPase
VIFTNTLHEEGIRPLIDELSQKICTLGGDEGQELFLSRERHLHLLIEAVDSLDTFQESFGKDIAIAAQNLRDAAESIGEIAGSVVNERILDELFSEFCIGK